MGDRPIRRLISFLATQSVYILTGRFSRPFGEVKLQSTTSGSEQVKSGALSEQLLPGRLIYPRFSFTLLHCRRLRGEHFISLLVIHF